MKKVLVFLCVMFIALGVIGFKAESKVGNSNDTVIAEKSGNEAETGDESSRIISVLEPAGIFLFGSGLIVLAGFGRKKFIK
jgi:hypothetical protein